MKAQLIIVAPIGRIKTLQILKLDDKQTVTIVVNGVDSIGAGVGTIGSDFTITTHYGTDKIIVDEAVRIGCSGIVVCTGCTKVDVTVSTYSERSPLTIESLSKTEIERQRHSLRATISIHTG